MIMYAFTTLGFLTSIYLLTIISINMFLKYKKYQGNKRIKEEFVQKQINILNAGYYDCAGKIVRLETFVNKKKKQ